ncbi:MAG: DUF222 domain-containing protein, partial [Actinobacteria bacterium]|nr:DUF222 domain-containing protein [Actinomycetota bacterium]
MSLPEVDELRESVEALLRLDAGGLGDAELHAAVVEVAGLRSRLEAAEANLIAAWDNRRVWAADGSRSAAAALARATGSSRADANRRCRRARRLHTMPATAEAFTDGSINAERVDVLCRANRAEVTDQFTDAEAMLVDHARTLDFDDLTRAVEYWSGLADDARTADRAQRRHEQRHAHVDITLDGTYALRALLEGIGGEV